MANDHDFTAIDRRNQQRHEENVAHLLRISRRDVKPYRERGLLYYYMLVFGTFFTIVGIVMLLGMGFNAYNGYGFRLIFTEESANELQH